jgi:hypothetical protein
MGRALQAARPQQSSSEPEVIEKAFKRRHKELAVVHAIAGTGRLIVGINEEKRTVVKQMVARSFAESWTKRELAHRLREVIGLTPIQAAKATQKRSQLQRAGVAQSRIDATMERDQKRTVRMRAVGIATHERALVLGKAKLHDWANQQAAGTILLTAMWMSVAKPGADMICIRQAATLHSFADLIGPPYHPKCRCHAELVETPPTWETDRVAKSEEVKEDDVDNEVLEEMISKAITPGGRIGDASHFSTSKTSNWVARTGGLPTYILEVAHALIRGGKTESEAIGMAVGTMKRWAAGEGGVSPKVRVAAAAALAEFEAKRLASHVIPKLGDKKRSDLSKMGAAFHRMLNGEPEKQELGNSFGRLDVLEKKRAMKMMLDPDHDGDVDKPGDTMDDDSKPLKNGVRDVLHNATGARRPLSKAKKPFDDMDGDKDKPGDMKDLGDKLPKLRMLAMGSRQSMKKAAKKPLDPDSDGDTHAVNDQLDTKDKKKFLSRRGLGPGGTPKPAVRLAGVTATNMSFVGGAGDVPAVGAVSKSEISKLGTSGRHVASADGAKFFKVPIGSPITAALKLAAKARHGTDDLAAWKAAGQPGTLAAAKKVGGPVNRVEGFANALHAAKSPAELDAVKNALRQDMIGNKIKKPDYEALKAAVEQKRGMLGAPSAKEVAVPSVKAPSVKAPVAEAGPVIPKTPGGAIVGGQNFSPERKAQRDDAAKKLADLRSKVMADRKEKNPEGLKGAPKMENAAKKANDKLQALENARALKENRPAKDIRADAKVKRSAIAPAARPIGAQEALNNAIAARKKDVPKEPSHNTPEVKAPPIRERAKTIRANNPKTATPVKEPSLVGTAKLQAEHDSAEKAANVIPQADRAKNTPEWQAAVKRSNAAWLALENHKNAKEKAAAKKPDFADQLINAQHLNNQFKGLMTPTGVENGQKLLDQNKADGLINTQHHEVLNRRLELKRKELAAKIPMRTDAPKAREQHAAALKRIADAPDNAALEAIAQDFHDNPAQLNAIIDENRVQGVVRRRNDPALKEHPLIRDINQKMGDRAAVLGQQAQVERRAERAKNAADAQKIFEDAKAGKPAGAKPSEPANIHIDAINNAKNTDELNGIMDKIEAGQGSYNIEDEAVYNKVIDAADARYKSLKGAAYRNDDTQIIKDHLNGGGSPFDAPRGDLLKVMRTMPERFTITAHKKNGNVSDSYRVVDKQNGNAVSFIKDSGGGRDGAGKEYAAGLIGNQLGIFKHRVVSGNVADGKPIKDIVVEGAVGKDEKIYGFGENKARTGMDEAAVGDAIRKGPDPSSFMRMILFDHLIANDEDRHYQNFHVIEDAKGKYRAGIIDHGRAFGGYARDFSSPPPVPTSFGAWLSNYSRKSARGWDVSKVLKAAYPTAGEQSKAFDDVLKGFKGAPDLSTIFGPDRFYAPYGKMADDRMKGLMDESKKTDILRAMF